MSILPKTAKNDGEWPTIICREPPIRRFLLGSHARNVGRLCRRTGAKSHSACSSLRMTPSWWRLRPSPPLWATKASQSTVFQPVDELLISLATRLRCAFRVMRKRVMYCLRKTASAIRPSTPSGARNVKMRKPNMTHHNFEFACGSHKKSSQAWGLVGGSPTAPVVGEF